MWSFTILGDECMYFILIILSAPPRCMWHGRVTHDSNSLCICSPKQILNMHKFRGSSYLSHTSQSDDIFHAYYHLSKLWSICCHQLPKRGRLKVQLSLGGFGNSEQHIAHWANAIPRWLFQESSMIGMAWMWKWNPQNAKDKGLAQAQKLKTLHFIF